VDQKPEPAWASIAGAAVLGIVGGGIFVVLYECAGRLWGEQALCCVPFGPPIMGLAVGFALRRYATRDHVFLKTAVANPGAYIVALWWLRAAWYGAEFVSFDISTLALLAFFVAVPWAATAWIYVTGDPPMPEPNTCAKCGYCLIGNESGRCPECGTPIKR
jgi:hypothetical protein